MKVNKFNVYSTWPFYSAIFSLLLIYGFITYILISNILREDDFMYSIMFCSFLYVAFFGIVYAQGLLPSSVKKIELTDDDFIIFTGYFKNRKMKISSLKLIKIGSWQNNYVFIDDTANKIPIKPKIENPDIFISELKKRNKNLIIQ